MTDPWLNQLGDLIGGSFSLNQDAFRSIVRLPNRQSIVKGSNSNIGYSANREQTPQTHP